MDVLELLRELAEGGEARIEVSLRLLREERTEEPKRDMKSRRPYVSDGRIDGYRGIASYLGSSVNFAMKLARTGQIRTYRIGRKIYAYEDEVMADLSVDGPKTSTVKGILCRHGYNITQIDKVCADTSLNITASGMQQ